MENHITDVNHDEYQYLNLVKQIIEKGDKRVERTGVGALSIFGALQRYSLQNNTLPLLTTKRVFTRGVIEELLWMISGSTNSKVLSEKGVHIWDANGSRIFLDNLGFIDREEEKKVMEFFNIKQLNHTLTPNIVIVGFSTQISLLRIGCGRTNTIKLRYCSNRPLFNPQMIKGLPIITATNGDLGPVYGFQWRHSGANYVDAKTDYSNQGIDQLQNVINTIKNNPADRRIIMCAWNPSDLGKMALPPCHCLVQFHVASGKLSCLMYQRSADMGLGVPFNIASYSLLTHMIAHITGLQPGEFIHTTGDIHVYLNHIEPLKKQLERHPKPFPTLEFARKVELIDDFKYEDFIIKNYHPHPKIDMEMAI